MDEENGNSNGEFRGFVRSDIKNLKDAAERNYEEHTALFEGVNALSVGLTRVETKLDAAIEKKIGGFKLWAALISGVLGLIGVVFLGIVALVSGG